MNRSPSRSTLDVSIESLPHTKPFRISGYVFHNSDVTVVAISDGELVGRGEASGVYYLDDEDVASMAAEIKSYRDAIEAGISRAELAKTMRAGGARNAVDCALWDLEAKRAGVPVWRLAELQKPRPLLTTYTIGADDPAAMAEIARSAYRQARALKLKLTGDVAEDIERVRAVRAARADVWLAVDANQGFTPDTVEELVPVLKETRVELVEQPFARGREADMDGFDFGIPVAADESVLTTADVEGLVGRFDVINIKLDKCGGLTEGLEMAAESRRLGFKVMVGNMGGSSWAMAPSFLVGQFCDVVDLDGPLFLKEDRDPGCVYEDGYVRCGEEVWGAPTSAAVTA